MPLLAAGIIGAGSLASGALGFFGSQSASKAQADAAAQALAFQKQVYANAQGNLNPFISTGQGANYTLGQLYGIGPGGASGNKPDFSSFFNSPDYNFAFQQGQNATQNLLSAKGNLLSGSGLTALTNYGQGLASQQYQNYVGRLQQLANMGVSAGASLNGTGTSTGSQVGSTYGQLGTAQASGIMGGYNALGGAASGLGNAALLGSIMNKNGGGLGGGFSSYFGGGNPGSIQ